MPRLSSLSQKSLTVLGSTVTVVEELANPYNVDLSSRSYTNRRFQIGVGDDREPDQAITVINNGMQLIGTQQPNILLYDLDSAYRAGGTPTLTTVSAAQMNIYENGFFSFGGFKCVHMNEAGTYLFAVEYDPPSNFALWRAEMTTPYDLTTCTNWTESAVAANIEPFSIRLSPSGAYFYCVINGEIRMWDLPNYWDVSDIDLNTPDRTRNYNIADGLLDGAPGDIAWSDGGTELFVKTGTYGQVRIYNCSTAWDPTDVTGAGTVEMATGISDFQFATASGLWMDDQRGVLFCTGQDVNNNVCYVYEYSVSTNAPAIADYWYYEGANELSNTLQFYGSTSDVTDNIYAVGWANYDTYDAYVLQKFNSTGSRIWSKKLNRSTDYSDNGYAVAVDSYGDLITCGRSFTATGIDGVIAKHSATSGSVVWSKSFANSLGQTTLRKIVPIDNGDFYVAGETNTDGVFANNIAILARFNSAGDVVWQRQFGNAGGTTIGADCAVDSNGDVYLVGRTASPGTTDQFLAKYNSSGVLQWQLTQGASNTDRGTGVAVDSSDNVYVLGTVDHNQGTAPFTDFVLSKYDSTGTNIFQKRYGSTTANDYVGGITINDLDQIYVTGTYQQTRQNTLAARWSNAGILDANISWGSNTANNSIPALPTVTASRNYIAQNRLGITRMPPRLNTLGTYDTEYEDLAAPLTTTDPYTGFTTVTSTITDAAGTLVVSAWTVTTTNTAVTDTLVPLTVS